MGDLDGFNSQEYEDRGNFEVLPKDDYLCIATEREWKDTASGNGNQYLEFKLSVIEGEHKGAVLFERLNLKNSNATAVRIAQQALAEMCRATNVLRPNDSADLLNKPMLVSVVVKEYTKKDGSQGKGNEIKKYSPPGAQPAAAPEAAGNDNTPPWRK